MSKLPMNRWRMLCVAGSLAALALVSGSSCQRSAASPRELTPAVPFDDKPAVEHTATSSGPDVQKRLAALAETLPSPCGQAHSLKKSAEVGCKRAPFAQKMVEKLVDKFGATDEQVKEYYRRRYSQTPLTFDLRDTPFEGVSNAPVAVVEFFDYECPHCRETQPLLDKMLATYPKDVALYYKHFPLPGHRDAVPAAKAAVAAHRQGKFRAMHRALFDAQGNQSREVIFQIARDLKLDMAKFEKDWNDPATADKVTADRVQGEKAKVPGTPALFINGRALILLEPEDLDDWIAEELAMSR